MYIKNVDLTRTDVLLLAISLGFADITDERMRTMGYVIVLESAEHEIAGFYDLPAARRFLRNEQYARRQAARLNVVVGDYGRPWKSHHGASGGVSLKDRKEALRFAKLAAILTPTLPGRKSEHDGGLWPGVPVRLLRVRVEGNRKYGVLIAECVLAQKNERCEVCWQYLLHLAAWRSC